MSRLKPRGLWLTQSLQFVLNTVLMATYMI